MATIKRREGKNGEVSYQIRVSNGFDEKGNRLMKGVTFKPKSASPRVQQKEAEKFAMELEEQVKLNGLVSVNKMTFSEVTEIWKENWLASKTPSVQEMYYDTLQRYVLPVFGSQTISKINATLIDSILHKLEKDGKAPRTVRYVFTCINSVMRYAVRKGFITENPCLRCDELPAVTKDRELHYFTLEQAKVFLNALKGSYPSSYKAHVRKLKSTN